MTEIRNTSYGAPGVFATQSFSVGDVIVEEACPLVILKSPPALVESSLACFANPKKTKKGRPKEGSWWENIRSPPSVAVEYGGKFSGMVQAAVCWAKHREPALQNRLFELYSPSPDPSEEEKDIIKLANEALDYLKKYAVEGSSLKDLVENHPQDAVRVMLIWSCNSFAGGRMYEKQCRFNHSCNPNAVVQSLDGDGQCLRAVVPICVGEEITISYLGLFLYSGRQARREELQRTKHFTCQCLRCREGADFASAIPCLSCHPRNGRYLDEDVQYDDERTVHCAVPQTATSNSVTCQHCHETVTAPPGETNPNHVLQLTRTVSKKVITYLQTREKKQNDSLSKDDIEIEEEWEEQLLQLSSTVVGARHWATNLMMLVRLDHKLRKQHADMISSGEDPDLGDVAESIDSLERLVLFVEGLQLKQHMGELLSHTVIGVSRTLVSLGDTKSKKYAADWLAKIEDYVAHFESDGMKKVVSVLAVAWKQQDNSVAPMEEEEDNSNKRARTR